MKKLISLIIAVILLLPSVVLAEVQTEEKSVERTVVEALTEIKLDYEQDYSLNRGEFSKVVYNIQNSGEYEASAFVFDDVDINSGYAGYIQYLYETGIIAGDGTGNFEPERKIRICEAYSMLLKLAGYAELIKGSYPEEIMKIAHSTGLAKNVKGSFNDEVNAESAYNMIYNLMYVEVMNRLFGENLAYEKGGIFMEEVLGIYEGCGIVESAAGYSLDDNIYVEEIAYINGVSYRNNGIINETHIGLRGDFYYTKDSAEDLELIVFIPKNNNIVTILAEDIESYLKNVYKYYENDKLKELKLAPGKDVLYNGTQALDENTMIPKYGYVILTDNNNDNRFDVVAIYEYKNLFTEFINYSAESITYLTNSETGICRNLFDLKGKEYVIYNEKGKEIALNELTAKSLLTVIESDDIIKIYQNTKTETGQITMMSDDGYITVNGNEYMIAESALKDGWDGKTLLNVTIYTDKFGNAAVIRSSINDRWNFAYVLKVAYETKGEDAIKFKLLCADGNVSIMASHKNKFMLDNTEKTVSKETAELIATDQVIRYRTDSEGKIIAVDTSEDQSSFDLTYRNSKEEDCLLKRCDGKTMYKSHTKLFKKYSTSTVMKLEGEAYVDENTVIFNVPESVTQETEDEDYYVIKTIENNEEGRIVSYNTDASSVASDAIIYYNPSDKKVGNSSRSMLVKNVKFVSSDSGDTNIIQGFYNGQETEKYVDERVSDISATLKRGDFIRVFLQNDIITDIQVIYSVDGDGLLNENYYTGTSDSYNAQLRFIIGEPIKTEGDRLLIRYNNTKKDIYEIFRPNSFKIYVYDPNLTNENCVYVGTPGDIVDSMTDPENYDTVIAGTREMISHDMLIIKRKR